MRQIEINEDESVIKTSELKEMMKQAVSFERFKNENEVSKKEIETLNKSLNDRDIELNQMKSEKVELEKMKADVEKQREANLKDEATKFAEELVKSKKQLPKFTDFNVSQYIKFKKSNDEEGLKTWKEQLSSNVIDKNFNKVKVNDNIADGSTETPKAQFKHVMTDEEVKDVYDEQDNLIQEHMKANNTTWDVSAKALGLIN